MRIGLATPLWVETTPDNGVAKNYYRLATALAARGHDVTVFFLNSGQCFWRRPARQKQGGFSLVELPCRVLPDCWKLPGRVPAMRLMAMIRFCWDIGLRSPRLDVIETPSAMGYAWLYCRLGWRRQPPHLVRFCTLASQISNPGGGFRSFLRLDWIEDALIRRARHLCTHTLAHRDKICSLLGIDPGRVLIIPLGIVPLSPDAGKPLPASDRTVLYVGRFEPRKGTDCLLAAIPKVLARLPECRFVLAGGGKLQDRSRQEFQARNGSLIREVRFLGRVTEAELEALYERCDFFVSPARYESFGMTYLEAMRHGRPVIGCTGSGSAEVIGDAGLTVPPDDAEALADAIVRLWTDRELHRELSARALLRAAHFSMERMTEETEQAYAAISGSQRPAWRGLER